MLSASVVKGMKRPMVLLFLALLSLLVIHPAEGQTPTAKPSRAPTDAPTRAPTYEATSFPTSRPSVSQWPTPSPTWVPSKAPTAFPTAVPTYAPSMDPTFVGPPSHAPTMRPTAIAQPTFAPSFEPSYAAFGGSAAPTPLPSYAPTFLPTTATPTYFPTAVRPPTYVPTADPTFAPTTAAPTTASPTGQPSGQPSTEPTKNPTPLPSISHTPTLFSEWPTGQPTTEPSPKPSISDYPTKVPTGQPTMQPTGQPTGRPSGLPSGQPSGQPTESGLVPTEHPTAVPSYAPTTAYPSYAPTFPPSPEPTTAQPTPATSPTQPPSSVPSGQPSSEPSVINRPSGQPTRQPTGQPTTRPTMFEERGRISSSPTALFMRDNVTGTVNFDPVDVQPCVDTEIKIHYNSKLRLNSDGAYRINMPGITIGDCTSSQSRQGGTELLASWPFTVTFFHGNASDVWQGSYIIAENYGKPLQVEYGFDLILDRSNGLKRTCGHGVVWDVFRYIATPLYPDHPFPTMAPTAADTDVYPPTQETIKENIAPTSMPTGIIEANEKYSSGHVGNLIFRNTFEPTSCFFYDVQLKFSTAMQQFDTNILLTLNVGFPIKVNDYIELTLPGFTNKKSGLPRNPGVKYPVTDSIAVGADASLTFVSTGRFSRVGPNAESGAWTGNWYEGDATKGYEDSYIKLIANREFRAGKPFTISVDRAANNLVSLYGRPPNYQGFKIKMTGANHFINYVSPTVLDGTGALKTPTRFTAQAIGDSCRELNYCSGNGKCNYEKSSCECYRGYGSPADLLQSMQDDFRADCSSHTCPTGPAFGALATNPDLGMHRQIECSNNGHCNRDSGECQCFSGFEGFACQKMTCPRPNGNPHEPICSDRGICKRMSKLSIDANAIPLSTTARRYETNFMNGTRSSWDAELGHGCVCDSSWKVGLTANTTQLAEFFGPACEFRRCPSGDDPKTLAIDETNCYGKHQTGGDSAELGQVQNKCHIDCSNQGTCDYTSGVCTCFAGFYGSNCGTRRGDMSAGTHAKLISDL